MECTGKSANRGAAWRPTLLPGRRAPWHVIGVALLALLVVGCGDDDDNNTNTNLNNNNNTNQNNNNTNANCGDGIVQTGEACDGDGAGTGGETATCDTDCTLAECGDGTVNTTAGETCDDGNHNNNDDCPDGTNGTCKTATCDDGFLHNQGSGDESDVDCGGTCGSTCGTGDDCNDGDDCLSSICTGDGTCMAATCGDGIVQTGEACDGDGSGTGGETADCDSDCTVAQCGDGTLNTTAGETCDDGNNNNNDDCPDGTNGTCETATCDDGFVHNQGSGDESDVDCGGTCGSNCTTGDMCNDADDCASGVCSVGGTCAAPSCGDGIVQSGEDCDGDGMGNGGETADCDSDCTFVVCGDGNINHTAGEACDDGNQNDNDDCPDGANGTCQVASCVDGLLHDQGTGTETDIDCGGNDCAACPGALLLSEIVVTPTGGEFIEIYNPSSEEVNLSYVYLADYNTYYGITSGTDAPNSSDFRVRFPMGTTLAAGGYVVIATQSATDFWDVYGTLPDFDFDSSDPDAVAMEGEIGSSASLTNGDEMLVMFTWNGDATTVADIDYVVWGNTSDAMDKTSVTGYLPDTAVGSQDPADAPGYGYSIGRCDMTEGTETTTGGNGLLGHDETSEDLSTTWEETDTITPGAANVCSYAHTIVIDGTNDFSTANDRFTSTSSAPDYTGYVSWDTTYLYIGMQGPDVNADDVDKLLLIYLDAGAGSTTTTGRTYNTQTPTLPFDASFHFHWATNNADTAAYTTAGSAWTEDTSWDWTGAVYQNGSFVELRLPLADIGVTLLPATVNLHLSMINSANSLEWTYAGVPDDSFTDGYDPSYTKYFSFELGGTTPPNGFVSQ